MKRKIPLLMAVLLIGLTAWAVTYREIPSGLKIGGGAGSTGVTVEETGDIIADGDITAATFIGDGSGLTGISGTGITALTGDVTASGTGSVVATIAAGAVDPAMLSATGTPSGSTYLRGDNTWATVSGSGDVVGPASATDNAIVRFDATTGKLVQNSVVTIADTTGDVAGVGTLNTHTIPGGTGTLALTSQITGTNSGTNTGDVSLAGTPDYITLAGQTITRGLVDLTTDVTGELPDGNVSNTLTASKLIGTGSTTDAVDLATAEVAGTLPDGNVSDTLTASLFVGSGSTTSAIDLATAEVGGDLPLSNIAQFTAGTFAGRALGGGTGDLQALTNAETRAAISNITALTSTGNAVSWTASGGTKYTHTLSENTTIGASTGAEGQIVIFMITKASSYTWAWNAQFKALDGLTASIPAIPATAGDIGYYVFVYHVFLDDWVLLFHAEYQP